MRILHSVLLWIACCLAAASMLRAESRPSSELESMLRQAGPVCLQAREVADLDTLSARFSLLAKDPSEYERRSEIAGAIKLLSSWRDYLTAMTAGNKNAAYTVMDKLLLQKDWLTLMPRSEVLRRARERDEIITISVPCKNWSDLAGAIAAIEQSKKTMDNFDEHEDLKELKKMQNLSRKIAEKDWPAIMFNSVLRSNEADYVTRFRKLLQARAIAGYLKLPPSYRTQPKDDETVAEFLAAIEKTARKENDWVTVWRVSTYLREEDSPPTNLFFDIQPNEAKGLDYYLFAQQLESAGKEAEAVSYYRFALSFFLPPSLIETIRQKLLAFQKNFPEQWNEMKNDRIIVVMSPNLTGDPSLPSRMLPNLPVNRSQPGSPVLPLWAKY